MLRLTKSRLYSFKENIDVIIDKYPYYESLNKKLIEDARHIPFYPPHLNPIYTNIRGTQSLNLYGKEPDSVKQLLEWVKTFLLSTDSPYFWATKEKYDESTNRESNFRSKIAIYSWMARYNEGDWTMNHNHTSALMGFVYFINTPKGSSPLVFKTSGKKIKAEEGKIVLFPGVMNHYVPKNKCKNRMILAGNIIFSECNDASF